MEDFERHGDDPDKIADVDLDMSPALISAVKVILINAEITFTSFTQLLWLKPLLTRSDIVKCVTTIF
jgi:hypothetical protein